MVGLSPTFVNNLVPYPRWKGDIHQVIAVDMAYLSTAEAILCTSKTMWMRLHTFPACGSNGNLFLRTLDGHCNSLLDKGTIAQVSDCCNLTLLRHIFLLTLLNRKPNYSYSSTQVAPNL
jgi:hypothetical protein